MRAFLAALGFLTVVPMPSRWYGGEKELAQSTFWLPFVGALIGLAIAALDWILWWRLPATVASTIVVVALLAITGGLHIDGLADTADGFLSSRPRARILEIMKDSRSGPMAIAAVVSILVLKVVSLAAIPAPVRWSALVVMAIAGRAAIVITMASLHYARPEGGTGSAFAGRRPRLAAIAAIALLGAVGWFAAGLPGVGATAGALSAAVVLCAWSYRRIGGWTGDTLGATCEIAEACSLVALIASATGARS